MNVRQACTPPETKVSKKTSQRRTKINKVIAYYVSAEMSNTMSKKGIGKIVNILVKRCFPLTLSDKTCLYAKCSRGNKEGSHSC